MVAVSLDLHRHRSTIRPFPSNTIVVVWSTIPPAPQASAAGVRTLTILQQLQQMPSVSAIHFVTLSPSVPKPGALVSTWTSEEKAILATVKNLTAQGIQFHHVPVNREEAIRQFLQETLPQAAPNPPSFYCHFFDRFYAEEMYAHAVHRYPPPNMTKDSVLMVLDMQDMHSLRQARQQAVEEWYQQHHCPDGSVSTLEDTLKASMTALPDTTNRNLLRELASIHRMDMTWVCSPYEKNLLVERYGMASRKLVVAPLLGDVCGGSKDITDNNQIDSNENSDDIDDESIFLRRRDFCFVGGFRHKPNVDAVDHLMRLWPDIRQEIMTRTKDEPVLRIYGAFLTAPLQERWTRQLQKSVHSSGKRHPKDFGIYLEGFADNLENILTSHRILLAPLTYGAGLKGKLVEAWKSGLPVVTTPVGAEGFFAGNEHTSDFPGAVVSSDEDFVQNAVQLYHDQRLWTVAHLKTTFTATSWQTRLDTSSTWPAIAEQMVEAAVGVSENRRNDITRAILWREGLRSTQHFAQYIELKEWKNSRQTKHQQLDQSDHVEQDRNIP